MFFKKKGYNVKLRGRSQIEYVEDGRKLILSSEFLAGDNGIVIYSSSLNAWEDPHSELEVTEEDKERIIKRVSENLEKHRIPFEWS